MRNFPASRETRPRPLLARPPIGWEVLISPAPALVSRRSVVTGRNAFLISTTCGGWRAGTSVRVLVVCDVSYTAAAWRRRGGSCLGRGACRWDGTGVMLQLHRQTCTRYDGALRCGRKEAEVRTAETSIRPITWLAKAWRLMFDE